MEAVVQKLAAELQAVQQQLAQQQLAARAATGAPSLTVQATATVAPSATVAPGATVAPSDGQSWGGKRDFQKCAGFENWCPRAFLDELVQSSFEAQNRAIITAAKACGVNSPDEPTLHNLFCIAHWKEEPIAYRPGFERFCNFKRDFRKHAGRQGSRAGVVAPNAEAFNCPPDADYSAMPKGFVPKDAEHFEWFRKETCMRKSDRRLALSFAGGATVPCGGSGAQAPMNVMMQFMASMVPMLQQQMQLQPSERADACPIQYVGSGDRDRSDKRLRALPLAFETPGPAPAVEMPRPAPAVEHSPVTPADTRPAGEERVAPPVEEAEAVADATVAPAPPRIAQPGQPHGRKRKVCEPGDLSLFVEALDGSAAAANAARSKKKADLQAPHRMRLLIHINIRALFERKHAKAERRKN